jgi:hypothetical protein
MPHYVIPGIPSVPLNKEEMHYLRRLEVAEQRILDKFGEEAFALRDLLDAIDLADLNEARNKGK